MLAPFDESVVVGSDWLECMRQGADSTTSISELDEGDAPDIWGGGRWRYMV